MRNVVDVLSEKGRLSEVDADKIHSFQKSYGGSLQSIISSLGLVSEEDFAEAQAIAMAVPYVSFDNLDEVVLSEHLLELVRSCPLNVEFFTQHGTVPIQWESGLIHLLGSGELADPVREYLEFEQTAYKLSICSPTVLRTAQARYLETDAFGMEQAGLDGDIQRLKELASETPIVSLVDSLIIRSVRAGASDLHIEPYKGACRARMRVDGVLKELEVLPEKLQLPIVSRIKILANLDIAEKRRPQDGKIEYSFATYEFDIRVSTLPLNEGESVVMRFLMKRSIGYDLDVLGIEADTLALLEEDLGRTAGVILLTGPTGSGKTTTLYSFLNRLNSEDRKIITLEDPVEYQLDGINQIQVRPEIGLDFSRGLRSIVRQDPDIIMLGEIRDTETARIAIQSSLTGHLVFSTVHTNDAPSAFTRLLDLEIDEYLLNAALISIVAQRLARKLCEHCAVPMDYGHQHEHLPLKQLAGIYNKGQITLRSAVGCKACGNTGYKGRVALVEYLRCDESIADLEKDAEFVVKARRMMQSQHRRNLLQDGLLKAIKGQTTIEEVKRVAG
ncbi:ATPase, T2SS/T4P/T4SS family [Aliiglaciecola sp. CAU 1673]|uniref:GspE/PulE family protein n=1 Tax=Aliiglaciecola sp. CAU 1673 TaxID=3032595 RepID=UPI0023DB82E3|nr:ATPase, T2SS/T4P/T4SS family [Aliiglaciecola sp. CAU 1673]MDF2177508.1 ATPase, T2SS/T4P/T4SS family [Aliiglaciecola sp. CAU 1673]